MPVNTTTIQSIAITDDYAKWLISANQSYARIYDIISLLNSVETDVYGANTLASLATTDKTSIIDSINSLHAEFSSGALISSITGLLTNLTTTNKTNLVAAINELDADAGDLATLTTTVKNSLVNAINELNTSVGGIGTLASLNTTDKSNLVNAINELLGTIGSGTLNTTSTDLIAAVNELLGLIQTNAASAVALVAEDLSFYKLDGSRPMTADADFGGFKASNGADGVAATDFTTVQQIPALAGSGDLTTLLTTTKASLVAAINELYNTTVHHTGTTSAAVIPTGTSAQRPATPLTGYLRYNTTIGSYEFWDGATWIALGGTVTSFFVGTRDAVDPGGVVGDYWLDTTGANPVLKKHDGASFVVVPIGNIAAGYRFLDTGGSVATFDGTNWIEGATTATFYKTSDYAGASPPNPINLGSVMVDDSGDGSQYMRLNDGTNDIWQQISGGGLGVPQFYKTSDYAGAFPTAGVYLGDFLVDDAGTGENYVRTNDGTVDIWEVMGIVSLPFDAWVMYPGEAAALEEIMRLPTTRALTFPNDFAGSVGSVLTNPASAYVISVERAAAPAGSVGVAIGTITISTTGSFTFASTAATTETFAIGEKLILRAPAVADGTIDTISITMSGTR